MIRRLAWPLLAVEAAAGTMASASPWLGAYAMPGTGALLVAAAVASVVVPVLVGVVFRRSPVASYGASLVGLAALLFAGVSTDPGALASGLGRGASHLVTDTLPLASPRWLLVPPVVVTWVTGAAVSELLTRTRRVALASGVLVGSFVVAYAACSAAPSPPVATGAIVLALVGALSITGRLVADADHPIAVTADAPAGRLWRPAAGGGALVAAVAVLSLIVVPAVPGVGGPAAAVARAAPTTSAVSISPLDAISALRDDRRGAPAIPMLTVATGQPSSGYLALAVLDGYDGGTWSFDRTFQPTGGRVPLPPAGTTLTVGPSVTQHYTLTRSFGPELPFIAFMDRPAHVTGLSVDMDPVTGMVVPAGRVAPATSYSVVSHAPARTLSLVPGTGAFLAEGAGADSQLPPDASTKMTPVLRYLAAATRQSPAPTVKFLQAVLNLMHNHDRRVDPKAPVAGANVAAPQTKGGTSLAEVVDAISVRGEGTPEQFATFFAVVARDLGVPARVVTGFRIGGLARASVGAGRYQVTNRAAWTWDEVPVVGEGWVIADPTSDVLASATEAPAPSGVQTPTTTIVRPGADALPGRAPGGRAVAPPAKVTIARHHRRSAVTLLLAGLAALAGVVVVVLGAALGQAAARRRWRRHLRRASDPAALAVGSWLEIVDALWRSGVAPPLSATSREVADLAGRRFGVEVGAPVMRVGELCDLALCSARTRVSPSSAGAAWTAQRRTARLLRGQLSSRQRLVSAMAVGHAPRRPVGRRGPACRGQAAGAAPDPVTAGC